MTLFRRLQALAFITISAIFVSACGGDDEYYNDHDHHHDDPPALRQFDIIDTYGTNSEFDNNTELAISPIINNGEFEIFWRVTSDVDYYVEFRINDRASPNGSRLISSELCGPFSFCHDNQYQFCDYSNSLNVRCESSSNHRQSAYIGDFLPNIPQDAYFILQVCDSAYFYCEYEARHVSIE